MRNTCYFHKGVRLWLTSVQMHPFPRPLWLIDWSQHCVAIGWSSFPEAWDGFASRKTRLLGDTGSHTIVSVPGCTERERAKESMCGVVLKTPVSKSRRGGRMVRRNDTWAVACTKRCGIHLSFFSCLSCEWEGIRFYVCVCVCPATWMNNLEVFQKSRTAGSDW